MRRVPNFYEPGAAMMFGDMKEHPYTCNLLDHSCMEGYACAVGAQNVPRRYADIANFADMQELWYASVERELANPRDMGVVSEISQADVPSGATVPHSKFDFRIKYTPDGKPAEYKSRLCVRGDQQEEGIEFKEAYAPTAAANTTRLLLAEAVYRDMHVHQVDVKAAFLNAPIEEELYMRPPHGIAKLKGKVWRLHHSIYGLRQAANAWHGKLSAELGKYGFTHCMTDPCLFVKRKGVNVTASLCILMTCSFGGNCQTSCSLRSRYHSCCKVLDYTDLFLVLCSTS
jgi:hypothetical protein